MIGAPESGSQFKKSIKTMDNMIFAAIAGLQFLAGVKECKQLNLKDGGGHDRPRRVPPERRHNFVQCAQPGFLGQAR
jgi:hypothetical protein